MFSQKKFFRSTQDILDLLLTHIGLANILHDYTKFSPTEIESQISNFNQKFSNHKNLGALILDDLQDVREVHHALGVGEVEEYIYKSS